ncbi:hypothetical protein ACHAXR_008104 [Thalassiosira sp. AJA248-18]
MICIAMATISVPKHLSSRSIHVLSSARTAFFSSAAALPCENASSRRPHPHPHPRPQRHFYSPRQISFRAFTSGATSDNNKLRIAVVGGGAAGMTAALHLSPLVAAGLVQGPIDVYESTIVKKSKDTTRNSGHTNHACGHHGGKQSYPGSGALGREIGVGLWSTAWWPFLKSLDQGTTSTTTAGGEKNNTLAGLIQQQKNRQSYQTLLQDLEACGSYVKDVGYRTPNGSWLVKSKLNSSPFGIKDLLSDDNDNDKSSQKRSMEDDDPAILFVREKDLLSCLRNAIKIEKRLGTVKFHSGVRVDGIENVNGDLGSLVLQSTAGDDDASDGGGENTSSVSPPYNLIIAADGIYSPLRSRFAGHHSTHATGTGIESSTQAPPKNTVEYQWEHTKGQRVATQVENREYIVFRGNGPRNFEIDEDSSGSFQTWGEERMMRFAAVPFYHETEDLDDDEDDDSNSTGHYSKSQSFISKKKDEEVWFATIFDPVFIDQFASSAKATDPIEQKQLLMKAFGSWHNPVQELIESTPAEDIIYEMAVAHRHNARPVFDVARIMEFEMWQEKINDNQSGDGDEKINGRGPIICFIGDSCMTVDPVLAQGFTMAMESGASIANSIERILVHPDNAISSSETPIYQPKLLRHELLERHYRQERRLLQLLRSTELVQRLAQPNGFGSMFATWIVRPVVKLCPEGLKKRVFDYIIRYSLGLTGRDR